VELLFSLTCHLGLLLFLLDVGANGAVVGAADIVVLVGAAVDAAIAIVFSVNIVAINKN